MARRVRKDKSKLVLQKGESQRKNGSYDFRWTDISGKRHTVYAETLQELREKERTIMLDINDGIRTEMKNMKVNDFYNLWISTKRGIKENTRQNYRYMYKKFVAEFWQIKGS